MIGERVRIWTNNPFNRLETTVGVIVDDVDAELDWVVRDDDGKVWHVVDQDIMDLSDH